MELASDTVPNIRFNAANALAVMAPLLSAAGQGALVQSRLKPVLQTLVGDADVDVQFYAARALEQIAE